jgi:hypothetical protein
MYFNLKICFAVLILFVVFANIFTVYEAKNTVKQAAAENDRWQLKIGCEELIYYERKFLAWIITIPKICNEFK